MITYFAALVTPVVAPNAITSGKDRNFAQVSLSPIDESLFSCYNPFTEPIKGVPAMGEQRQKSHISTGLLAHV